MQTVFFAASFAWAKTGKRIAAKIAIIAITTSNSMSVNARRLRFMYAPVPGDYPGKMLDRAV
jgi:hypothetical protein